MKRIFRKIKCEKKINVKKQRQSNVCDACSELSDKLKIKEEHGKHGRKNSQEKSKTSRQTKLENRKVPSETEQDNKKNKNRKTFKKNREGDGVSNSSKTKEQKANHSQEKLSSVSENTLKSRKASSHLDREDNESSKNKKTNNLNKNRTTESSPIEGLNEQEIKISPDKLKIFSEALKTRKEPSRPKRENKYYNQYLRNKLKTKQVNPFCDGPCAVPNPEIRTDDTNLAAQENHDEHGKGRGGMFGKKSAKDNSATRICFGSCTEPCGTKQAEEEKREKEIKHAKEELRITSGTTIKSRKLSSQLEKKFKDNNNNKKIDRLKKNQESDETASRENKGTQGDRQGNNSQDFANSGITIKSRRPSNQLKVQDYNKSNRRNSINNKSTASYENKAKDGNRHGIKNSQEKLKHLSRITMKSREAMSQVDHEDQESVSSCDCAEGDVYEKVSQQGDIIIYIKEPKIGDSNSESKKRDEAVSMAPEEYRDEKGTSPIDSESSDSARTDCARCDQNVSTCDADKDQMQSRDRITGQPKKRETLCQKYKRLSVQPDSNPIDTNLSADQYNDEKGTNAGDYELEPESSELGQLGCAANCYEKFLSTFGKEDRSKIETSIRKSKEEERTKIEIAIRERKEEREKMEMDIIGESTDVNSSMYRRHGSYIDNDTSADVDSRIHQESGSYVGIDASADAESGIYRRRRSHVGIDASTSGLSISLCKNKCAACIHRPWWLEGANLQALPDLFTTWLDLGPSERAPPDKTKPNPKAYENEVKRHTDESDIHQAKSRGSRNTNTSVYSMTQDKLKPTAENTCQTRNFRNRFMNNINQPDTPRTVEIAAMEYFFGLLDMLVGNKQKTKIEERYRDTPDSVKIPRLNVFKDIPIQTQHANIPPDMNKEVNRPSVEVSDTHPVTRNTLRKTKKNTLTSVYKMTDDRSNKFTVDNANQTSHFRDKFTDKFTQTDTPRIVKTDAKQDFFGVIFPTSIDMLVENKIKTSTGERDCGRKKSFKTSIFTMPKSSLLFESHKKYKPQTEMNKRKGKEVKNPGIVSPDVHHAACNTGHEIWKNTTRSVYNTKESKLKTLAVENANQTNSFRDQLMAKFSQLMMPKIIEIDSKEYIMIVGNKITTSIYNMMEDRLKSLTAENANRASSVTDETVNNFSQFNTRVIDIDSKEYIMVVGNKIKTVFEECSETPNTLNKPRLTVPRTHLVSKTENDKYKPLEVKKDNKVEINFKTKIDSGLSENIANPKTWQRYKTRSEINELRNQDHQAVQTLNDSNDQITTLNPYSNYDEYNNYNVPINSTIYSTHTRLSSVSSSAIELTSKKSENSLEPKWEPLSYEKSTRTSLNSDGSSNKHRNIQRTFTPVSRIVNSPVWYETPLVDHDQESIAKVVTEIVGTQTLTDNGHFCFECGRVGNDATQTNIQENISNHRMRNYYRPRSLSIDKNYTDKDSAYSSAYGSYKPRHKLIKTCEVAEKQFYDDKKREYSSQDPKFEKAMHQSVYFNKKQEVGFKIVDEFNTDSYYDINNTGTQCTPSQSENEFHDKILNCFDYIIFFEPVDVCSLNVEHPIHREDRECWTGPEN